MNILRALARFRKTGEGDLKQLKGSNDYRLRVGDYRVCMRMLNDRHPPYRASETQARSVPLNSDVALRLPREWLF
jgi:hypothetical protein